MMVTCPACGFAAGIESFIADGEWREAVLAAAALPSDCGPLVVRYAGLFRPEKRALTPSRAARLLREVCAMITDGVDFDRRRIEAPSHIWRRALIQVLDAPNIQRPLRNHHYLLRVVQSLLAKRDDAIQAERHRQRRSESHVRNGAMRPLAEAVQPQPDPLDGLDAEPRRGLFMKARQSLIEDGFKPGFIIQPLIEQRMRELLEQEENHAENR